MPELALTAEQQAWVLQAVHDVVPQAQVQVFGSRATGRARPFSDLDLLLTTPERLSWQQRCELAERFEQGPLPFQVDVVEAVSLAPGMQARVLAEARSMTPAQPPPSH